MIYVDLLMQMMKAELGKKVKVGKFCLRLGNNVYFCT